MGWIKKTHKFYTCPYCGKKFNYLNALVPHKARCRDIHLGEVQEVKQEESK